MATHDVWVRPDIMVLRHRTSRARTDFQPFREQRRPTSISGALIPPYLDRKAELAMSTYLVAYPGPFEPDPCITQDRDSAIFPARLSTLVVVIIVMAWTVLVAAGASPAVATAGLGGAASLGLQVAARLMWRRTRGGDRRG